MERLSTDQLGRATLARQGLLEREAVSAYAMVERLAGLQSQAPAPPYPGLWTRIAEFGFGELAALLEAREVVRIVTLRGTVHLHTAADALMLRPFTQQTIERQFQSNHRKRIAGFDPVVADALARERLADGPATGPELAEALSARWPEAPAEALANAARCLLPLVQIPPRGLWGRSGAPTYALLDEWTGHPLREPDPAEIVRRYLAAFGPATVKDAQAWCGVTRLRAAFDLLGEELVRFEGPAGEPLYDLAEAPRPPADTPVPVRLLPEWDNLLIGYADHARVIDPANRKAIFGVNGVLPGTVLVDGRVAATYRVEAGNSKRPATAALTPLRAIPPGALRDARAELERLLGAMGDGYAGGDIVIAAG